MSQSRRWVGGTAVVAVLLVLASYFLLIAPKRAHASDLRAQAQTQRQANDQLKLDIAQLKVEHATLPARQAELAVIQQQMPSSPNLPSLIRSLTTIAGESGVTLNSMAPAAPQPVTVAPSSTGTATATTAAAPQGLTEIPVTIIVQGDYASSELFVQKVQTQMRRAFLVQSLSLGTAATAATGAAAPAAGTISTTLTGDVFVLQPTPSSAASSASGPKTPASGSSN